MCIINNHTPCLIVRSGVILQFLRFLRPIINYDPANLEYFWKNPPPVNYPPVYLYKLYISEWEIIKTKLKEHNVNTQK